LPAIHDDRSLQQNLNEVRRYKKDLNQMGGGDPSGSDETEPIISPLPIFDRIGSRPVILPRQCVPHFFEVIYVFNDFRMKDYPWTGLDRNIADTLSIYWTNFAKAGDPNGPGLTHWPICNPKDEFLNINDTVRLERFNSAGIDLIARFQEELRRAQ
jgi:hypothetical protein